MEATSINKSYSGRVFDAAALELVRGILRAHAGASRQQLSYRGGARRSTGASPTAA